MSLFIRVMTNFYSHRKTARLRVKIGDAAFWIPPRLWAYAAENQPDGVFQGYEADELAMHLGYSGDPQALLEALIACGFVDSGTLKVHNWEVHNGYHQAYSDRAKKAAQARWSRPPSALPRKYKTGKERTGKETSNASRMLVASETADPKPKLDRNGRFAPPTIEMVRLHFAKIGVPEKEAELFIAHHEARGWILKGGVKMRNWQAACVTWKSNLGKFDGPKGKEAEPELHDYYRRL